MWLNWLVFCDYGFSVSALWCPLATPTILLWVSLTLDMGYLFTAAPAKRSHCSFPWIGVSPNSCPFWPWMWNCSSRPSCAHAATGPWTWGWIRLIIFFAAKDGEALYSQQKQDWELTGSDHELLITKFRTKLKKVGKTIQVWPKSIPYDYTVEVRNRFKGLDVIDRMP